MKICEELPLASFFFSLLILEAMMILRMYISLPLYYVYAVYKYLRESTLILSEPPQDMTRQPAPSRGVCTL